MSHLWHSIPSGANPPRDINVIIEIPSGSKCKYELDKIAGIFPRLQKSRR
jgi:inorganic pyrophosphatase